MIHQLTVMFVDCVTVWTYQCVVGSRTVLMNCSLGGKTFDVFKVLDSSIRAEYNLAISHILHHLIVMSVVLMLLAATLNTNMVHNSTQIQQEKF